MSSALHYQTIGELVAQFASGAATPVRVTEATLERISTLNPSLNAYISIWREKALAQANAAESLAARDGWTGLRGVPVGLKDLYHVTGEPTRAGAITTSDAPASVDSFVAAALAEAGAVTLGKHNMHEYALGVTNINAHYGPVRNPWSRNRVPGGSSGGTGAAIAAGLCYGGFGSDTGGSIRIPASLCGIAGLKPTRGRISLRGVYPLSWSLDTAGPMARSVADCARLLAAVDLYDPADPTAEPGERVAVPPSLRAGVSGLRVLVAEHYFVDTARPDIAEAVLAAARVFERLGAIVQTVNLDGAETLERMNGTIALSEAATVHADDISERPQSIGPDVLTRLQRGQGVTGTEVARARRLGVEWRHRLRGLLGNDAVLLTPTTRITAPAIEGIDSVAYAAQLTAYTAPFNLVGLPALSVPCGFSSERLPIGLQIVGGPWQDDLVLRAGYAYERATEWHTAHPPV